MNPTTVRVHRFLKEFEAANGMMPVQREIAEAIGWKSTNSVYRALTDLEARGLIKRRGQRFALTKEEAR